MQLYTALPEARNLRKAAAPAPAISVWLQPPHARVLWRNAVGRCFSLKRDIPQEEAPKPKHDEPSGELSS